MNAGLILKSGGASPIEQAVVFFSNFKVQS